jgi:gas vesicle protein
MSDNKDTFLAFVFGGLVGAVLGILYAPKSGLETRRDIRKFSKEVTDTIDGLKETGHKVYEEGCERAASGEDKVSEVFEKYDKE